MWIQRKQQGNPIHTEDRLPNLKITIEKSHHNYCSHESVNNELCRGRVVRILFSRLPAFVRQSSGNKRTEFLNCPSGESSSGHCQNVGGSHMKDSNSLETRTMLKQDTSSFLSILPLALSGWTKALLSLWTAFIVPVKDRPILKSFYFRKAWWWCSLQLLILFTVSSPLWYSSFPDQLVQFMGPCSRWDHWDE